MLYARFYGALIGGLLLIYHSQRWAAVTCFSWRCIAALCPDSRAVCQPSAGAVRVHGKHKLWLMPSAACRHTWLLMFSLHSFWLPQILYCIRTESRQPLRPYYVLGEWWPAACRSSHAEPAAILWPCRGHAALLLLPAEDAVQVSGQALQG